MSRPLIVEHNLETNEIDEREMNDAEYATYLKDKANFESLQEKKEEAEAAKAAAKAKLEALGLSLNDLKALGLG